MLERLLLIDFQRHTRTDIEFSPNVTMIVGPSNKGKTSIIRALRWLAFNRPTEAKMINWDAERCEARLRVDGHTIGRSRGNEENLYWLDKEKYTAFGTAVPAPITERLNIDEYNFQRQLDPVFWLSDTPGEVSKQLNAIVNLSSIDNTLANIAARKRKTQTELEVAEANDAQARSEAGSYIYLNEQIPAFEALEATAIAAGDANALAARCVILLAAAKTAAQTRARAKARAVAAYDVHKAGVRALQAQTNADRLATIIEEAKGDRLIAMQGIPSFKPIQDAFEAAKEAKAKADKLAKALQQAHNAAATLNRAQETLTARQKQYKDYAGTVCPTCNRPL